jgi:ribose 5-phosphate isomerase B
MNLVIPIIADHAGVNLKNNLLKSKLLKEKGINLINIYSNSDESDDYPDIALFLKKYIKEKNEKFAIAICGSGIGISIALNRFTGIRAVNGFDLKSVQIARKHNDANVLCLGERSLDLEQAVAIILEFVTTSFEEEQRHLRRISKLDKLDTGGVN